MSDPLHLLQLRFDAQAVYDHARRRGRRGIQLDDPGYLLHMVLAELVGKDAILTFRLKPGSMNREGDQQLTVLAYSHHDLDTLSRQAEMTAEPDVFRLWHRRDSHDKPMPTDWPAGHVLGFEALAYPVRRVGSTTMTGGAQAVRDLKNPRATYEVDAWLAEKLKEDARWRAEGRDPKDNPGPPREPVYRDWFSDQLTLRPEGQPPVVAATAETIALESWQRDRFWRPQHGAGKGSTRDRPLVLYRGTLRITDPTAFATLLARGIGRHRAFGLGMLLLKPV